MLPHWNSREAPSVWSSTGDILSAAAGTCMWHSVELLEFPKIMMVTFYHQLLVLAYDIEWHLKVACAIPHLFQWCEHTRWHISLQRKRNNTPAWSTQSLHPLSLFVCVHYRYKITVQRGNQQYRYDCIETHIFYNRRYLEVRHKSINDFFLYFVKLTE